MQYGLTQFGRPLAASLVTAAGTAVCAASATANAQKTRVAGGAASVKATVTLAPKRTATAHPQPINCTAAATGRGAAQRWSVSGLAAALAQVSGRSRVDFVAAASVANAYGQVNAQPLRRARAFARQAQAFATLDGQGYIFELAYPSPARATAWGFGTTYQTGHGEALATAALSGQGAWASGGAGRAVVEVIANATWAYTAGGQGVGVVKATAWADAAVRREGIRYFEGFGIAEASANCFLTTLAIYQSQTAHAYAHLVQSSIQIRGARGKGKAYATAIADALTVGTAATLLTGTTHAVASGRAQLGACGRGAVSSKATAIGAPLVRPTKNYGAMASALAMASAAATVCSTKVYPDTAYGVATAKATMNRIRRVVGQPASADAVLSNTAFVRNRVAVGVALAQVALSAASTKTQHFAGLASADAVGAISVAISVRAQPVLARASMTLVPKRDTYGIASGAGRATASGYNQVNDLLRAPAARTLVVEAPPRLFDVPAETRLLAA